MTKKYILLYVKRVFCLVFGVALATAVPLLLASLFADAWENDILFSLYIPFLMAVIVLPIPLLYIPFGIYVQRLQEKTLAVAFSDSNAQRLYPRSYVFLSDDWVIWAGRLVLHRAFIRSITVRRERPRQSRGGYYCICKCMNGKQYRIFVASTSEVKKIKQWYRDQA